MDTVLSRVGQGSARVLAVCGLLACALAAQAGPVEIVSVEVTAWAARNAPYPALAERLKDRPAADGVWRQITLTYRCAGETAGAIGIECSVLLSTRKCGPVILRASHEDDGPCGAGLHRVLMYVMPSAESQLGKFRIEGVAARLSLAGQPVQRVVQPPELAAKAWRDCRLIEGLLVDHLESPWAHLAVEADGRLVPRPVAEPILPADEPGVVSALSESAGAGDEEGPAHE